MKIVFNGTVTTKKSGGCAKCGQSLGGENRLVTNKTYFLPSGQRKAFSVGNVEEVSDTDGAFLLSYVEPTSEGYRKVFSEA